MGKLNTVQNGKGSKKRPVRNLKQYYDNWNEISWSTKTKTLSSRKET